MKLLHEIASRNRFTPGTRVPQQNSCGPGPTPKPRSPAHLLPYDPPICSAPYFSPYLLILFFAHVVRLYFLKPKSQLCPRVWGNLLGKITQSLFRNPHSSGQACGRIKFAGGGQTTLHCMLRCSERSKRATCFGTTQTQSIFTNSFQATKMHTTWPMLQK